MMKPILLILLVFGLTLSCQSTSKTPKDHQGKQLEVANGGGFTGQEIKYTLLDNGQLFRHNSLTGQLEEMARLDKNTWTQIFENYEVLNLNSLELDQPGNMYFYISYHDEEKEHLIKWNTESAESEVKTAKLFYQTFMNRIKK